MSDTDFRTIKRRISDLLSKVPADRMDELRSVIGTLLRTHDMFSPVVVPLSVIFPRLLLHPDEPEITEEFIEKTMKRWAILFGVEVKSVTVRFVDSSVKGLKHIYALIYTGSIKRKIIRITINTSLVNKDNLLVVLMHEFLHYLEARMSREDFIDTIAHVIINGHIEETEGS